MTGPGPTYLAWGILLAGAAVLALGSLRRRPHHPSSELAGLLANPYARSAALLGWMWLGWHLFAR